MKYAAFVVLLEVPLSPPTRGCELKFPSATAQRMLEVTPHAGVRIEIELYEKLRIPARVTPHAGVRIEIFHVLLCACRVRSPPTRGCELKFLRLCRGFAFCRHPPRGGAN